MSPEPPQVPPPAIPPIERRLPSWSERALTRLADLEFSDLLGARALAWTGAVVSMLGIALLFVLAVDRGWVGPEVRLAFGALASITGVGLGLWLRRRFGEYYAALGATGAGIAGAYATLLSAAAIYDFIPAWAALLAAAAIAAVGVWVSIAWSSQMVAGLGLIGAMASAPVVQQDVTVYGGAFIALIAAATAAVAIYENWRELLIVGGAVSAGQVGVVLAGAEPGSDWRLVALAGVFWLIYTATGIGWQWRAGVRRLRPLAAVFIVAGISLAGAATAQLFAGTSAGVDQQGAALLLIAVIQTAIAAELMLRRAPRDLTTLLWGTGFVVAAVAGGLLLSASWLTLAWAGAAAVLAWHSVRLAERRFQLAAAVYLGLALGYALAIDAVPEQLFSASRHPADGALSVAFVVAATGIFAWYCRRLAPPDYDGSLGYAAAATWLDERQSLWKRSAVWLGAALAIYAMSLAILEFAVWVGSRGFELDFDRGQVAVTAFWAVLALAALTVGRWRGWLQVELASYVLYGIAVAKLLAYDSNQLDETLAWLSGLCLGAAVLVGSAVAQALGERPARLDPIAALLALASIPMLALAAPNLVSGERLGVDLPGAALLGVALAYGILAVGFFRRARDYSTLVWATGLAVAAVAAGLLLAGTWLTLAWAVAAAALAWISVEVGERRLQIASAIYVGLAAGHALAVEAVPNQLFDATTHPAHGAISVAFVVAATGIFAWYCRRLAPPDYDGSLGYAAAATWLDERQSLWKRSAVWLGAALAIYAMSLAILEFAVWVGSRGFELDFDRGHVAVSAFWAVLALAAFTAGRWVRWPQLELAGFVLFALALVKLVAYDASQLDSTLAYLSSLCLGAAVLAASPVAQRLSALPSHLDPVAALFTLGSIPLLTPAIGNLTGGETAGIDHTGAGLLGLALVYGVIAAVFFGRQRDYSTLNWVTGLVIAGVAAGLLLTGTWLTLAWAAAAAALAWLSVPLAERRLQLASAIYLGVAAGHALAVEAVPEQLFVAREHPGHGAISVAFVVAAASVFAWYCRRLAPPPGETAPAGGGPGNWLDGHQAQWKRATAWLAAALAVYSTSLGILELAQAVGGADVDTKFQRGHTGVSAFWGVAGVALLYLGLVRRSRVMRLTGFAWFGVLLAKIFIYDLRELSSVARALSFLAVGALLLGGAFLYQRITKGFDRRDPRGPNADGPDHEPRPGSAT